MWRHGLRYVYTNAHPFNIARPPNKSQWTGPEKRKITRHTATRQHGNNNNNSDNEQQQQIQARPDSPKRAEYTFQQSSHQLSLSARAQFRNATNA